MSEDAACCAGHGEELLHQTGDEFLRGDIKSPAKALVCADNALQPNAK